MNEQSGLVLLFLVLLPQVALARAGGITGVSGKQGMFCNQCHAGGQAPTVSLTGPTTLLPGASATYTLTITGGAGVRGGFNAAASAGAVMAMANGREANGEVTHMAPVAFAAGTLSFSFAYVAPMQPGAITLYAAGNSVNFNTTNQGDLAATTTLMVTVSAPPASVDAGTGVDAGSSTAADAGTGSTGTTGSTGGGTTGGGVDPLDAGSPTIDGPASPITGTGHRPASGYPAGVVEGGCSAAGGVPFVLAALLMSLMRRRRVSR